MNLSGESRFDAAIERFDALNSADPNHVLVAGAQVPKELAYARWMTQWLDRVETAASEPLRLAARSQHLMRWHIPRDTFPIDRPGYLRWRTTLYGFHADRAAEVLTDVGYDDATIAQVRSLIRKEHLKTDPDAQTLEDVICLVFLETELAAFAKDREETQLIRILRRTWQKMSPRGQKFAMELSLPAEVSELIAKALVPATKGDREG